MTPSDFTIGMDFSTRAGFLWRCTDVGTRTITAVSIEGMPPELLVGPPYMLTETIFDEKALEECCAPGEAGHPNQVASRNPYHPGYDSEALFKMLDAAEVNEAADYRYNMPNVLRYPRVGVDGEIYDAYTAEVVQRAADGNVPSIGERPDWDILLYGVFTKVFTRMSERSFLTLPIATVNDYAISPFRPAERASE